MMDLSLGVKGAGGSADIFRLFYHLLRPKWSQMLDVSKIETIKNK